MYNASACVFWLSIGVGIFEWQDIVASGCDPYLFPPNAYNNASAPFFHAPPLKPCEFFPFLHSTPGPGHQSPQQYCG